MENLIYEILPDIFGRNNRKLCWSEGMGKGKRGDSLTPFKRIYEQTHTRTHTKNKLKRVVPLQNSSHWSQPYSLHCLLSSKV